MFKKFIITLTLSITAVALVAMVGCVDPTEQAKRPTVTFNHKKHMSNPEDKCTDCHKLVAKEGAADYMGMPTVKGKCMKCHEGLDEKKPPERGVLQNYTVTSEDETDKTKTKTKTVWRHVTVLPDNVKLIDKDVALQDEVKFSHKRHVDARVECTSCHIIDKIDTMSGKVVKMGKPLFSGKAGKSKETTCIDCHAQTNVAQGGAVAKNNCSACHKEISKEKKPDSHNQDWKELHGRMAGFQTKSSNNSASCDLCHTEQSCIKCHRSEQPKNHNNFWRERGHGVTADLDRSTCKVCHTEDSCIRCHKSVAPNSHKGNWGSQHCNGCHTPLKENGCVACHKDTRSHLTAPKLPSTKVHQVAKSSDCRTCHFGLKLQHVDNGDDCLSCHRR